MNLLFILYFSNLEMKRIELTKMNYFNSTWKLFDFITIAINIVYFGFVIGEVTSTKIRPLASVAVLFMWIKLFYFLRIF